MKRLLGALALPPVVSLVTWLLVASLPVPVREDARTDSAVRAERRQYGAALGTVACADAGPERECRSTFDPRVPWQNLIRGANLSRGPSTVSAAELLDKLVGSVRVGALSLGLVIPLAFATALVLASLERRRASAVGAAATTLAFATPVFVPVLLAAPSVLGRGEWVQVSAAAALLAIVPGLALGEQVAAAFARERAADYVRTARAKGAPEWRILLVHVRPNVWPDLLDGLRPTAAALLAGSFAVESILGLPYFGRLYVQSVIDQDPGLVVVCTGLFAAVVAAVDLVVEAVRPWLDPRARGAS